MCSVSEENDDDCIIVKQRSATGAADGFCVKCKASTDVISIKSDEKFCSQCLLVRLMHKFRSEFGKAHIVRGKEPVLVAYSGGQCSSALLHLVMQGLSKKTQKKLRFIPTFIHIDEDVLSLPSARAAKILAVAQNMHATGLPYCVYTLTQMQQCEAILVNEQNDPQFDLEKALANINWEAISTRSSVEAINSSMSKESLIHFWKMQTLMHVARIRGFGKVIVGDTASNLAARVLSYVAQGRGSQLASEVDFADVRYGDVTIVRPMREFSEKEVDAYCSLNLIEPVLPTRCLLKTVAGSNSVESLSRRFVGALQSEHDHTVPIIFRTAEKLIVTQDSLTSASRGQCIICGCIPKLKLDGKLMVSDVIEVTNRFQAKDCPVVEAESPTHIVM